MVGELIGIERALRRLGDAIQRRVGQGRRHSQVSEALVSAGGILIIGISLKLLDVKDVKVGNFLPALVFAPVLVGIVTAVR